MIALESFLIGGDKKILLTFILESSELTSAQQAASALLIFLPGVLYLVAWVNMSRFASWMSQPKSDVYYYNDYTDSGRIHVLSYTQDEVYQFLSMVINLVSLLHHVVFVLLLAIGRIVFRTKVLAVLGGGLLIVFTYSFVLMAIFFSMYMLIDTGGSNCRISGSSAFEVEHMFSQLEGRSSNLL